MPRIQLDDEVMRCFEDAAGVLGSKPGTPIDFAVLAAILMEMSEAICVQLEKNRRGLLACHDLLERMLDMRSGTADCEPSPPAPAEHG